MDAYSGPGNIAGQIAYQLFADVMHKESTVIALLDGSGVHYLEASHSLVFTLPDLFSTLRQIDKTIAGMNYLDFRKQVFSFPMNEELKDMGCEITIQQNWGNVDKSEYRLVQTGC